MKVQLTHKTNDETLVIAGISDWQQSKSGTTIFLPVSRHLDEIPQELSFPSWEIESGSDSSAYTTPLGKPTAYLHETIELSAEHPNTTVWVIPSDTHPVLANGWDEFHPTTTKIAEMTD